MTERLKEESERLFEIYCLAYEQEKVMERAVYLGMTPDEAKQAEARLRKLQELVAEAIHLCKGDTGNFQA